MSDLLSNICAEKQRFVSERMANVPLSDLEQLISHVDPSRGFELSLRDAQARGEYCLIAEIKRASPSKGLIRRDFNPTILAQAYTAGGATCLSVLTDEPYFQGCDSHLRAVHSASLLPILRKDFILNPYQALETRAIGADCLLLILAAVDDVAAAEIETAATDIGLDVLIEVHNETELERASKLKSNLIGINNRDLATLEVDLTTTERLIELLQPNKLVISESGLKSATDLKRLNDKGVDCFLVGESLMSSPDVENATRMLLSISTTMNMTE